jgi:hypothetical protein
MAILCLACTDKAKKSVTVEPLTATVEVKSTQEVPETEVANSNGFCHIPQYKGEGKIFFESKNVCIMRGTASGLLRAYIQASTLTDFEKRKAFAERKLEELVSLGLLSAPEVCSTVGLFGAQADLGGRADIHLTSDALQRLGCVK